MTSGRTIEVIAYPRIHITLIGMGAGPFRANGGLGFAIDHPVLTIGVQRARATSIVDKRKSPFSSEAMNRIMARLEIARDKFRMVHKASCTISGELGTHSGFGTTTSIRLACLEGLFLINNTHVDQEELIELSGRGGTSGVGIQSYFSGGFVFDIGQQSESNRARPSSANEKTGQKALAALKCQMPEWPVGIIIDEDLNVLSEQQEKEHFSKVCPIPDESVFRTLYYSVYGVVGAVMENDWRVFCEAIKSIQMESWKSSEIRNFTPTLDRYIDTLNGLGATVGMSSMGPLLYFLAEDVDAVAQQFHREYPNCTIHKVLPMNAGRVVKREKVPNYVD